MPGGDPRRLLRRLEAATTEITTGEERVGLAFSGGLKSLVLGSLLRKRTHVVAVVAGFRGCPDITSAGLAKQFLDFDLRIVILTRRNVLATAREIAAKEPALPLATVLDLIPIHHALARFPRGRIVFGLTPGRVEAAVRKALASPWMVLPLAGPSLRMEWGRAELASAGRLLGLPEAFLRQRARRPAVGSGVEPALRRLVQERRTTSQALLREGRRSRA